MAFSLLFSLIAFLSIFFSFPSFLQKMHDIRVNPGSPLINSNAVTSATWYLSFPLSGWAFLSDPHPPSSRTHVHLFKIHLNVLLCKPSLTIPRRNYFLFWLHSIISRILFVTLELPHSPDSEPFTLSLALTGVSTPFCPLLTCLETGFFFPSLVLAPQNATATLLFLR